jgi:hypothetical protein
MLLQGLASCVVPFVFAHCGVMSVGGGKSLPLIGTVFGVMLNRLFPTWLLVALLVVVLTYSAYRAFVNTWKLWKKEQQLIHGVILHFAFMKENRCPTCLCISLTCCTSSLRRRNGKNSCGEYAQ